MFSHFSLPINFYWLVLEFNWGANQVISSLATGGLIAGLIVVALQNYRLSQEVNRRQQVEAEFRASEAHYQALINALPVNTFRFITN